MTWKFLALAGDGAYILVRLVGSGEVFATDQRVLGSLVRQAPALVGVHAGLTDMHALTLLLGAGQLVVPALIWSAAVLAARTNGLVWMIVSITAGICAGTTWFFSVSESVMGTSLTALVGTLLWRPDWGARHMVGALGASVLLVASYETAMVTGLVLASWAGLRARHAERGAERYACAGVCVLSGLSVLVAVRGAWESTYPTHSRSLLYFIVELQPLALYLSLLGLLILVWAAVSTRAARVRTAALGIGVATLTVAVAILEMSTAVAFAARGGAAVAVFVLLALLWWLWTTRGGAAESLPRALLAVPVLFVAAMLAVNVQALAGWSESVSAFRSQVNAAPGVVDVTTVLPAERRDVLWNWTASSLSLILRERPDAGVLVDRRPSYVPFPPDVARDQIADEYVWSR